MDELRKQAKDIYDLIYKEGIVAPDAVVARVLDYVLKREDEVRKETAKEIYKELFKIAEETVIEANDENTPYIFGLLEMNEMFKKFGVEVDE